MLQDLLVKKSNKRLQELREPKETVQETSRTQELGNLYKKLKNDISMPNNIQFHKNF